MTVLVGRVALVAGRDGIVGNGLSVWLLACLFSWLEGMVAVGSRLEELVLVCTPSVLVQGV
jgi:hypothetical protein